MADWDRMKASLFALIRAALPRVDYYAMYHGKVVAWHQGDLSHPDAVDVAPNDPKIPTMAGVPFRHGLPGVTARVGTGTSVLVGWENGDPSRKFACLWSGGESVARLTQNADALFLGGEAGAEPPVKGTSYNVALVTFLSALTAYVTAIKGVADPSNVATPAMLGAITSFGTAAAEAQATNVFVK